MKAEIEFERLIVPMNYATMYKASGHAERCVRKYWKKELGIKLRKSFKRNVKSFLSKRGIVWERGIPDFFYFMKDGVFFIEVKEVPYDGLSWSQLNWFVRNKHFHSKVVYVEYSKEDKNGTSENR